MNEKELTTPLFLGLICAALSAQAGDLSITYLGEGTVNPSVGVHSYSSGMKVNVHATAAHGWSFDHWEGSFAGEGKSFIATMDGNKRATAVFVPNTATPDNALARYVGKFDPNFSYYKVDKDAHFGWTGYTYSMNSQAWRDLSEVDRNIWNHEVDYTEPWFSAGEVIMLVDGGSNPAAFDGPDSAFAIPAIVAGIRFSEVGQVPNEPLYFTDEDNIRRSEDGILAYSIDKYLVTGDDEWPVHEAMVKTVVRAMDLLQSENSDLSKFIITGGSKRGWTTWLTAAVDPRIVAFAPIVIDVLKMDEQMVHHWEAYGFYAPSLDSYVEFDIFCRMESEPLGPDALKIIDPYEYIDDGKLTQPKLVLSATGDQFFLPDGSRFYYPDLPGETRLRYIPNADHGLRNPEAPVVDVYKDSLGWGKDAFSGAAGPRYSWTFESDGSIRVKTVDIPDSVRLWQATNPNARDFRIETLGAVWTSSPLSDQGGGVYIGSVPEPAQGWTAYMVELTYNGREFTSEVGISPDTVPFAGTSCQPFLQP